MKSLADLFKKNFCRAVSETGSELVVGDEMVELCSATFNGLMGEMAKIEGTVEGHFNELEEGTLEVYVYHNGSLSHLCQIYNGGPGGSTNSFVYMSACEQGAQEVKLLAKTTSPKLTFTAPYASVSCEFVQGHEDLTSSLNEFEASVDQSIEDYENDSTDTE